MKPLAVFYHGLFSSSSRPIDTGFACRMMQEQMRALKQSGLLDSISEFQIGINGSHDDAEIARLFAHPSAKITAHGARTTTEIPTLNLIRQWLPGHDDWYVLYHHMKGVTHPGHPAYDNWRRRMEKVVVWDWRECISQLDRGIESCGAHWLTPEQFPTLVSSPFWGGTFWWATARFLLTLPPLPPATWANRFEAESWIGRGPRRPSVRDYYPGWP